MVNDSDGNNLFNINAGAKEGSATVYDSGNQLVASIHRTSAIYRHYAIDDQDGNRRYEFTESSKPSDKAWTIMSGETEIGGVKQISHEISQELMSNRGVDRYELESEEVFLLALEKVVEEKDLFALLGGVYGLMTS
jgi:hypothetical protein